MSPRLALALICLVSVSIALPMQAEAVSKTITVRFHYPESSLRNAGSNLYIRGDTCGLNWFKGTPMSHITTDLWQIELSYSSSSATRLQIKALVDDSTWQIGANVEIDLTSAGHRLDLYPYFFTGEGSLDYIRNLESKTLGNSRDIIVYLPPSYNENTLKTMENILVMHDGQNLFDPSTAFMGNAWMCQNTVNPLIYEGKMQEVMIVGINNTPNRIDELTYSVDPTEKSGGRGDDYLDFIEQVVFPALQAKYRVGDLSNTRVAIGGSSLGGLISCYAGVTRPNIYNKAICMSSSFWWNNQDFNSTVIPKHSMSEGSQIYLDSGDSGDGKDDEEETLTVRGDLERLGYVLGSNLFYYLDKGGEHNEHYWGQRFHVPMTDLYAPRPLSLH